MDEIFVAGHGITPNGTVFLSLKDRVAKTALFGSLARATKTGSIFLARGVTMEEAKEQFPVGRNLSSMLQWGEPRVAANSQGEALANIYNVEEIESEVAEEATDAEPVLAEPAQNNGKGKGK